MSQQTQSRALGRGLSALLGDQAGPAPEQPVTSVPIAYLRPGPVQPRRRFDEAELKALADSIREKGILQPILVRPVGQTGDVYEIIAGERRWRAAQLAGLHEAPVTVRRLSDQEALEISLVENIQRENLTPIEEAEGYRRLMQEFGHTQEALAEVVGKSRSHVANLLRLLSLPGEVKAMVDDGRLSMGHARALLTAADPTPLAAIVARRRLSVRQTERLVAGRSRPPRPAPQRPDKDADTLALERDLSAVLGLKVSINHGGEGGELVIRYNDLEQLDDVLRRLAHGPD